MTSSVRFEAELDKVEMYDESWVLKMFIWGLPQDQAVLVSQGKPTRLTQAFQLAGMRLWPPRWRGAQELVERRRAAAARRARDVARANLQVSTDWDRAEFGA